MIKTECRICGGEFNVKGEQSFFRLHLAKIHNIKSKEYYDKYFKKQNEDICEYCGKLTKYISFKNGYSKHCSYDCSCSDPLTINKSRITKKLKYDDENFNNRESAKNTCLKIYGVTNISKSKQIKLQKTITCLKNHGVDNYTKTEECKNRVKETCLKKYNVDNPSKYKEFKDKRTQTIFEKYGVYNYSTSREYRLLKERLKEWIPLELKTDFEIYSRKVWNETKKHKKKLFGAWDGKCYYTQMKLDKNLDYNNENYPSVDHKISVFYGFSNNIDPKNVGKIENLSICSRWANNKKGIMIEVQFKNYLNENYFFNEK